MRIGRLLKRIGLLALTLLALAAVAIGGLLGYDVLFGGRSAAQFANMELAAADGSTLQAYLAQPDGAGPHPAVLMIHEWWGLNEDIVAKADLLARQGYTVLAIDLWRGVSTKSIPRAITLVTTTPQQRLNQDVDAALAYLEALQGVDPQRIAVLGFCFGGRQSLLAGTRHAELAATIVYYGEVITDPSALGALRDGGPVLGIFGEQDGQIPLAEVKAFGQAMTSQQIRHEITIYPGVGHAFANSVAAISAPGPAQQAWQQTLRFLEQNVAERQP